MAEALVDSLSAEFDPSKYRDEYREQVLDLIERKAAGEEFEAAGGDGRGAAGRRPDGCARGERQGGQGRRKRHPAGGANGRGRRSSAEEAPVAAKPKRGSQRARRAAKSSTTVADRRTPTVVEQPRQGALPGRRARRTKAESSTTTAHRAGDAAAPRRPLHHVRALPERRRQEGLLREALPEAPAGLGRRRRSGPATTTARSATAGSTSRPRWCGRRTWPRSSCTCRWRWPHDLDTPPTIVFDFDPGAPATIVECCQIALLARDVLAAVGLEGWAKTSGSKGLQLYVPLNTPRTHEQAADFALAVGQLLEKQHPKRVHDDDGQGDAAGEDLRRLEPERPPQDDDRRVLDAGAASVRGSARRSPGTRSRRGADGGSTCSLRDCRRARPGGRAGRPVRSGPDRRSSSCRRARDGPDTLATRSYSDRMRPIPRTIYRRRARTVPLGVPQLARPRGRAAPRAVGARRDRAAQRSGSRPASTASSGIAVPEQYGGGGIDDYRFGAVMAEEIGDTGAIGSGIGFTLHNDIVLPYFLGLANDEQQDAVAARHGQRRADRRDRDDRAEHRQRPRRREDDRRPPRRHVRRERREDVHLQRHQRRRGRHGRQDRSRRRRTAA